MKSQRSAAAQLHIFKSYEHVQSDFHLCLLQDHTYTNETVLWKYSCVSPDTYYKSNKCIYSSELAIRLRLGVCV